jgi:hypothetical protein
MHGHLENIQIPHRPAIGRRTITKQANTRPDKDPRPSSAAAAVRHLVTRRHPDGAWHPLVPRRDQPASTVPPLTPTVEVGTGIIGYTANLTDG